MPRICFVSNEIHPATPGGAGLLIHNLARGLLEEGHPVTFLLDLAAEDFARFDGQHRLSLPNAHLCRAYHVGSLCASMPCSNADFASRYIAESARYEYALRQVDALEKPELIEFCDYCGPAYFTLCAKAAGLGYQGARIAVRMHGPISLIDQAAGGASLDFDRYAIYALESASFRLADTVLYPTPGILGAGYGLETSSWLGEARLSPPIVAGHPVRSRVEPDADIALFYGRLYAEKGVDLFVDAAIELLSSPEGTNLQFYLAGADSKAPPDPRYDSYAAYLRGRIPRHLRGRFTFTGYLSRAQLEALLPRVKFAVLPSYYETYCLAAIELRLAGVPLIVSDIPAFRDNLKPGVDALYFEGGASGLARQMQVLESSPALLEQLSRPFQPPPADPLGFYRGLPPPAAPPAPAAPAPGLLVAVLEDSPDGPALRRTLAALAAAPAEGMRCVVLRADAHNDQTAAPVRFLGGLYSFFTPEGAPLAPAAVLTEGALLLLRAGDEPLPGFLAGCLGALACGRGIGFAGSWAWVQSGRRAWPQTHPLAAMLELAPFEIQSNLTRCVMRTPPGVPLAELFDQRAGRLGEIAYLWGLETPETCGIDVPALLLRRRAEPPWREPPPELPYLVQRNASAPRSRRLAKALVMLASGYPRRLLPLQAAWAGKSGQLAGLWGGRRPMLAGQGLRGVLSGSAAGRALLGALRGLRSWLRRLRRA